MLNSVTSVTHFVCLDFVENCRFNTLSAASPTSPRNELYRLRLRTGHWAFQPELAHQFEHCLFRHRPSLSEQNGKDAPVPVGTLRLLECATDSFLDAGPGVAAAEPEPVVVERRPGKVRELQ